MPSPSGDPRRHGGGPPPAGAALYAPGPHNLPATSAATTTTTSSTRASTADARPSAAPPRLLLSPEPILWREPTRGRRLGLPRDDAAAERRVSISSASDDDVRATVPCTAHRQRERERDHSSPSLPPSLLGKAKRRKAAKTSRFQIEEKIR